MTAAQPAARRPSGDRTAMEALAVGAVDMLEVAARLESSGIGDRAVGRHGRGDVFALAAGLYRRQGLTEAARRRRAPSGLEHAVLRAVLLVAGVLLAAEALDVLQVSAPVVWIAGGIGWVGSQIVAAIAWNRLGWGQGTAGQRRAGAAALLVLAIAAAAPALLVPAPQGVAGGTALSVIWTGYACAVSVLVCARRTAPAMVAVLAGALATRAAAAAAAGQVWAPTAVLTVAAVTAGIVVLMAVRVVAAAGGPAVPARPDWNAAAPAAVQAVLLAASLLALLRTLPEGSATALVVGGVVGAATADPAIALLRMRLRSSAARLYLVEAAARRARRAAVAASASTAAVSALAAVAVVLALQAGNSGWTATVVTAAAFTAMATTAAALTAFGVPWRAVLAAALAAVYAGAALLSWTVAVIVVFPLTLLAAVALLLHRVSDPRVVV